MSVTFELAQGEKCKRTLKITVAQETVQEKFDEVFRKLKAEAQIPGFRKGRAPLSTIKARYGAAAAQDVLEDLMDESYKEAIQQSGLTPVDYPHISEVDFGEGKPLTYTAELEIRPEIKLETYTGFELKQPDDTVKDGEVKEMLEYLQRKHSSLEVVERPAQMDDFVLLDLEVLSDSGGKLEQKKFENVQLELVEGPVASQFGKQLSGLDNGAETEIEIDYPQDHFDKRFGGSRVRFKVNVKAIRHLNLIPLDESFFKQFDEKIATLEEFREKLRADIQARKTKEATDALREEAIKEVIDKNRFDLPDALVERYLDRMVEDYRNNSQEKIDEEQVRQQYRAVAIRQIRWDLLYHEIAEKEQLRVEQSDLDAWLQRFADNYKMTLEQARKTVTDNRRIADLKETILEHKVIDLILNGSKVEKVFSPMVSPEQ
ncbi:MAG: trigger factor [candidate division Zixibacteria bacterium]|nr:trigger factor [candidate division Zixibacteria bacterium]